MSEDEARGADWLHEKLEASFALLQRLAEEATPAQQAEPQQSTAWSEAG